jgi:alkylation response protein AidB-like acyl-CoA dehydrogenase
MDLTLTEPQDMLVTTAREFLRRHWSPADVRRVEREGFDPALWRAVSELGWPGLALPAGVGGTGQGMLELALVAEEMGRAACSCPLLPSTTLVALPVLWAGSDSQRARWLPALARGEAIGAPALLEPGMRDEWGSVATTVAGGRVTGSKTLVPYAAIADVLVVSTDGGLVLVDTGAPGVSVRRQAVLGGDPLYEVAFDGAECAPLAAPASRVLARALDHAAVAAVAYATGLVDAALSLSVRHARDRVQFGRPIGSFQAIAHRCADIRADVDACRLLVQQAAWSLDESADARLHVAAAKAYGNDAVRRAFAHAHQVHGAIGFTTEHDLQLYSRRAKAFELTYGDADRHLATVAEAMGL